MTSKGRITLPKKLRDALRLRLGSRIRFRVEPDGALRGDPVLHELEDLWRMADEGPRPKRAMTREDMDAAKAKRRW